MIVIGTVIILIVILTIIGVSFKISDKVVEFLKQSFDFSKSNAVLLGAFAFVLCIFTLISIIVQIVFNLN